MSAKNPQSAIRNPKSVTGTREWAASTANCCLGCSHGCLYCYARHQALRFGRIQRPQDWTAERVNDKAVAKPYGHRHGTVMFPTTHDITPTHLDACRTVLGKLLAADNRVLVVSKPHRSVIRDLCVWFRAFAEDGRLRFRFTIGTVHPVLAAFWEPHAPEPWERIECLKIAMKAGFQTSVSCEPLLAMRQEAIGSYSVTSLLLAVSPWVTETIWIGAPNHLRQRAGWAFLHDLRNPESPYLPDHPELDRLDETANVGAMREVHRIVTTEPLLADIAPKVRWKDSYRKVLGLAPNEQG